MLHADRALHALPRHHCRSHCHSRTACLTRLVPVQAAAMVADSNERTRTLLVANRSKPLGFKPVQPLCFLCIAYQDYHMVS